jgi:VTC domain.
MHTRFTDREPDDRCSPAAELQALVGDIDGISLSELDGLNALLMTRVERKHLMTTGQCRELITGISDSYRVLEVQNIKTGRYETMYYDNNSFINYIQHHNGKGNRYKLRYRHYESSGDTFLEVKKKSNRGATEKTRIKTCRPSSGFAPEEEDFLRSAFPYDFRGFHPVLTTMYDRFTLVSKESPERITFDTGVSFRNSQRAVSYPGLVIGEIKYEKGARGSPALHALRAMGIRTRGFSKYCTGVALLYDQVKHNRFRENLLFLSRHSPGGGVPC